MDCLTCNHKPVCKIHEDVMRHAAIASITVKDCTFYTKKEQYDVPVVEPAAPVQPPVLQQQRDPADLGSISDRIKSHYKVEEKTWATCPDCDESYETSEFRTCQECNQQVCMHCLVQGAEKKVCESCWSEEAVLPL